MIHHKKNAMGSDSVIVLIQRGWQAFSGLITLYLIAHLLSPMDQGFYYTITVLVGMMLALDAGLTNILVPFAAKHIATNSGERAIQLEGDFLYIGKYAIKWFFWTGILMLIISPLGLLFLNVHNHSDVDHVNLTWVLMVLGSTANYMISPIVLLLEGSDRVREVYSHRLYQGILASIITWIAFAMGAGILAVVVIPVVSFFYTITWLGISHFDLIKKIYFSHHYLGWTKTIWPIQWRTGGNIFAGYLLVFIYTPIYYQIFGPKEAGQIGLTMACLNTIFVLSLSPLVGKFPLIARLISEDREAKASELYQAELKRVLLTYCLLAIVLLTMLVSVDESLAGRFMDLGPAISIVIGMFFYLNACALGYFMRAHLVDTSLRLNLISLFSMLAIGIAMSYWVGMWGVPLAMLIVFAGILYPGMKKIVRGL